MSKKDDPTKASSPNSKIYEKEMKAKEKEEKRLKKEEKKQAKKGDKDKTNETPKNNTLIAPLNPGGTSSPYQAILKQKDLHELCKKTEDPEKVFSFIMFS